MARFPHGGEILGATPANPLLAPVLRPGRDLNRQQALLDLAAIQRISGYVGYWKSSPEYLFTDTLETSRASVDGVAMTWVSANQNYLIGAEINTAPTTWTVDTETTNNGDGSYTFSGVTAPRLISKTYAALTGTVRISFRVTGASTASLRFSYRGLYLSAVITNDGDYVFDGLAGSSANLAFYCSALTGTTATISNISIKSVDKKNAYQTTATFKPILRQTSASNLYWLDSNTPGSALTATLGNLGTACTVAQIDANGPYFTENVTITSTYNLTAPYGYGGDIAIFNRALTASEKALVTRYMRRSYPEYDFPVRGAPDAWWLTVDTTDVSQTWTVSIETGTTPNITVDWGDATVDTYTTLGDKTHTYATAGRWYPKITGGFASGGNIRFGENAADRARLKATAIVPTIPGLANFQNTFDSCTGLTTLPAALFRYNTSVSTSAFDYSFRGCTGLTAIPVDIFRYNTSASAAAFRATFQGCTGLTALPEDIFKYNTSVGNFGFQYTFINCSSLTTIPADLFRYNTSGTISMFFSTFQNCNKLQLRSDIFFRPGEESTRFLNQSADFTNAMRIGTFTGTQGTAPALWDCSYGTGTPTTTTCFTGQTSASVTNYASIPTAWGGA